MGQDECVSLLHAVEEIQARHDGNLDVAHRVIIEAHELGDLDLRLQRPDGSITDRLCEVIANLDNSVLWDELFRTGLLNVSARPPRWKIQDRRARRRVQPNERCRIVVTRASLEKFLKTMPVAKAAAEVRAKKNRRYVEDDGLVAEGVAGIQTNKWPNPLQAAIALAGRAKGTMLPSTIARLRKKISNALGD
jgi:hypothetical protein